MTWDRNELIFAADISLFTYLQMLAMKVVMIWSCECVGQVIIYDAHSPKKFKIREILIVAGVRSCYNNNERFVVIRFRHALITWKWNTKCKNKFLSAIKKIIAFCRIISYFAFLTCNDILGWWWYIGFTKMKMF